MLKKAIDDLMQSNVTTSLKEYIKQKIYDNKNPVEFVLNHRPINSIIVQNDYFEKFIIKDKQTVIYMD